MKKEADRRGARRWICWRAIVARNHRELRGRRSVKLHLECGHQELRKDAAEPAGDRARCKKCQDERR